MSAEALKNGGPSGERRKGFPYVKTVVVLIVFSILMALGFWQVERLHWKLGLLDAIHTRIHATPVPLAEVERIQRDGGDIEYRHVRVSGTFDNTRERDFFATFEGATGFFVYTPLTTDDGKILFVNRGFVPYDLKDQVKRPQSLAHGHVTLTGLARAAPPSKPSFMVPDNDLAKNIFYWKDLKTMASSVGLPTGAPLVPFFVDADRTPGSDALPIGGVTFVNLPNNHLQYAFTWFGLAAVLLIVALNGAYRRWKGGR